VQDRETFNPDDFLIFFDVLKAPEKGRIVALDLGTKKVGIAVCDELQITTRGVRTVKRAGWKKFLKEIIAVLEEFDAVALVLGLPLESDGTESEMSSEARRLRRNFSLSLEIPVFLQDERNSTYAAQNFLWNSGLSEKEARERIDSEAAAIILQDFLQLKKEIKNRNNLNT
jgi:putative holliday junction resolvase